MSDDNVNVDETIADEVPTAEPPPEQGASAVAAPADPAPAASREAASKASTARNARKVREGIVVSQKMDKTAVVAVTERVRHAKYNKFVLQTTKLYAHDETNDVNIGDRVRVTETRPLSKLKRWRVSDILERAK